MQVKAIAKFIKISPIKAGTIRKSIVGREVHDAINTLENIPRKSAGIIKKVVQSCFANAKQKNSETMHWYVQNIIINEGPKMKRIQSATMGRGVMIRKRSSHITVILDEQAVVNKT
ncbi:MAG: 50S ribosomal protein L22 [Candidatus Omnitrophica bacterium]|nr:50S ribosomal protein L22 [Candidatus Omnitrophota bacterium]